jgi:hypothetical protein
MHKGSSERDAETVPGSVGLGQLRLVETDPGLHERVVQGVAEVPIAA